MRLRVGLPFCIVTLACTVSAAAVAADGEILDAVTDAVTYEEFMAYDKVVRKEIFSKVTPETRARLMRAQLERCLDAYQEILTPEQTALAKSAFKHLTPAVYDDAPSPEREADRRALKEITKKARAVFDEPFFMQQLFTLDGSIPRKISGQPSLPRQPND